MSMFQCPKCGCAENTSFACRASTLFPENYDWTDIETFRGQWLCSACMPSKFSSGQPTGKGGEWHGKFPRKFLPLGMFKTGSEGNLEHKETGDEDYAKYITHQIGSKIPGNIFDLP